jgi:hypothetical protein
MRFAPDLLFQARTIIRPGGEIQPFERRDP